jgi:hypothetical protein
MSVARNTRNFFALLTLSLITLAPSALAQDKKIADEPLARVFVTTDMITLNTNEGFAAFTLKVKGPNGTYFEESYDGAEVPFVEAFDPDGNLLPDGAYTYELVGIPEISGERRWAMEKVRGQDSPARDLRDLLPERAVQNGYFHIEQGAFVLSETEEAPAPRVRENVVLGKDEVKDEGGTPIDLDGGARDQVIGDDLIVTRSICVGFDCVNGEVFGFDTIRLKENNLRIKFMDTSVGSFPSSDWQLTANDSASGGANKFSIDDISGSRTPFTIEASTPSHSLYVDNGGRIGFGTSTPVVELHVVDGDTPTLRLQQDGSSGFQPQTWDVAGNETSFFVRDATNGSTLPFRIRPTGPNNALVIDEDGDIGVGVLSADPGVHVFRNSATNGAELHLEQTNASGTARVHVESANSANADLLRLTNGGGQLQIVYENGGSTWTHFLNSNGFAWVQAGDSENAYQIRADGRHFWGGNNNAQTMTLSATGDLVTAGTMTPMSDKNMKEGFEEVDPHEVLATIAEIPITTWKYIKDDGSVRHMGPMAQDFYAAFGLGFDNRHIATTDLDGVALAAIKGLNEQAKAKDAKIADLEARLAKMEALLQKLAD